MTDPFAAAAARIVQVVGEECVHTSYATGTRTVTTAVLDLDVEIIDELGNIVDRDDMISLLHTAVGAPKSRDTVEFPTLGKTYTLGRTVRDDGYVAKMMAHRDV